MIPPSSLPRKARTERCALGASTYPVLWFLPTVLTLGGDPAVFSATLVDGGGRRDRTDDLLLAKQALSQLSYAPKPVECRRLKTWWAREDLNLRPHAYQARALTN